MSRYDDNYDRINAKWTDADQRAYDAATPEPWKDLFWQKVAIATGRNWWGVYKACQRRGLPAKVDASMRQKCSVCGTGKVKAIGLCEMHYIQQAAMDGKPWAIRRARWA